MGSRFKFGYGFVDDPVTGSQRINPETGQPLVDPWIYVSWKSMPYPVPIRMRLGWSGRGRLVCTGVRIQEELDGETFDVSPGSLRKVPLGEILTEFWWGAAGGLERHGPAGKLVYVDDDGELNRVRTVIAGNAGDFGGTWVHTGPKGHSDETLRQAARWFSEAVDAGERDPYRLVAERIAGGRSESQTRRILQKAWARFPELRPERKPKGGTHGNKN